MTEIVKSNGVDAQLMENVIIGGDLGALSPEMRLNYYRNVCESLGLNPLTKPFEYIRLNGKMVLYTRKDATDQLRKIHGISLNKPTIEYIDDVVIVSITAHARDGRGDSDIGAVSVANLKGEARANAVMKAITKAKRRVTLSIAGLGFTDESEVETIPNAQFVTVDTSTGEINEPADAIPSRVAEWLNQSKPADAAKAWAVEAGAQPNDFAARNSLRKIVDEQFGGKLNGVNLSQALHRFYLRQQEHLAEQAEQVETVNVADAEPVAAY